MKPIKRKGAATYEMDVRWRGYPRLRLSCGTTSKARAGAMSRTLLALRDAGRRDLLGLLATHRLTLAEVHDAYTRDPASLEHLRAKAESLPLGLLVDEWLAWCKSPAGLSPRTKRPYTPKTVRRYAVSWEGFYAAMVAGRETGLNEVTRGFLRDYRRLRVRATGGLKRKEVAGRSVSAATFNRDMAALSALFTWLHEVKGHECRPP